MRPKNLSDKLWAANSIPFPLPRMILIVMILVSERQQELCLLDDGVFSMIVEIPSSSGKFTCWRNYIIPLQFHALVLHHRAKLGPDIVFPVHLVSLEREMDALLSFKDDFDLSGVIDLSVVRGGAMHFWRHRTYLVGLTTFDTVSRAQSQVVGLINCLSEF